MLDGLLRPMTRSSGEVTADNKQSLSPIQLLERQMHCVVLFMPANSLGNTAYKDKLRLFKQKANDKGTNE